MKNTMILIKKNFGVPRHGAAVLCLVLAAFAAVTTGHAWAHEDPPGPPNLLVKAAVSDSRAVPLSPGASVDNELGGEEFRLFVVIDHQNGHGKSSALAEGVADLGSSAWLPFRDAEFGAISGYYETKATSGDFVPNQALALRYAHDDCTPRDTVLAYAGLAEMDAIDTFAQVFVGILGIAATAVGLFLSAGTSLVVGIGMGLLGIGLEAPTDDDYGAAIAAIPAEAAVTLNLSGAEGAATVTITGSTPVSPTRSCTFPVSNVQPPASLRTAQVYDRLEQARLAAQALRVEGGNPGQIRCADLQVQRTSVASASLRLGAAAAGTAAQQAAGFLGGEAAIAAFSEARGLDLEGQHIQALAGYRQAFELALIAIDEGEAVPRAPLPRDLLVVPDLVLVRPTARVDFSGIVLGLRPGDVLEDISLYGQVEGMQGLTIPGHERQGLIPDSDLGSSFPKGQVIGLRRLSGHRIAAPDFQCDSPHVEDATLFHTGITIDGGDPLPEPALPCAYGRVASTALPLPQGGIPIGASFAEGYFLHELSLQAVEPGTYPMELVATINTAGGGFLYLSTPVTLVVSAGGGGPDLPSVAANFGSIGCLGEGSCPGDLDGDGDGDGTDLAELAAYCP